MYTMIYNKAKYKKSSISSKGSIVSEKNTVNVKMADRRTDAKRWLKLI